MALMRSEASAAIHETGEAMSEDGAVAKQTMCEFDEACVAPLAPMLPERIRALREHEHLPRPAFAFYLNVSRSFVSDWERGVKKPSGPALLLLTRTAFKRSADRLKLLRAIMK